MEKEKSARENKIIRANKSRKLTRLERETKTTRAEIAELDKLIEKGGEGE